jgi:hypothetical protein
LCIHLIYTSNIKVPGKFCLVMFLRVLMRLPCFRPFSQLTTIALLRTLSSDAKQNQEFAPILFIMIWLMTQIPTNNCKVR